MADFQATNVGAYITSQLAFANKKFGQGVGQLPATFGDRIDRTAKRPLHLSGKLVVGYDVTIASGQSIAVVVDLQTSDDDSTYTSLKSTTVTIPGLNAGTEQKGTIELDVNLIGAGEYLKAKLTGTLTASGSDIANLFATLITGGGETAVPASLS